MLTPRQRAQKKRAILMHVFEKRGFNTIDEESSQAEYREFFLELFSKVKELYLEELIFGDVEKDDENDNTIYAFVYFLKYGIETGLFLSYKSLVKALYNKTDYWKENDDRAYPILEELLAPNKNSCKYKNADYSECVHVFIQVAEFASLYTNIRI